MQLAAADVGLDGDVSLFVLPPRVIVSNGRTDLTELLQYFLQNLNNLTYGVIAIDPVHLAFSVASVKAASHEKGVIDYVAFVDSGAPSLREATI